VINLLSKLFIKFLFSDGQYLRNKLARTPLIYGDSRRVHLGKRVDLQDAILNVMSGSIFIGSDTFCGHGVMILTGTHKINSYGRDRQQNHPTAGNDIIIGKGVWLASGSIILGGVTICDNAVVASGAVVTKDISTPGTYAGCPAKVIPNS
jgi:acetyltransferase-like isoleucine patch superfamily enzyme